ncbi:MAG: BatA domain-containing protein, partial [Planctomycetota bacterium]
MFLYPALVAGFAFVAVPLLVHLINLLRHQKRRWAAMDFLMASYRKQRKWIRMRQLLLLLSRLAVAALL